MQYYIKFFNTKNNNFVGYYKETGKNCISTMMNGIKFFNDLESAKNVAFELDGGDLRDKDGHYYTSHCVIYADSKRQPPKEIKQTKIEKEEELKDALDAFIRKNSSKTR